MTTNATGVAAGLLSAVAWAVGAIAYKKFGERLSSTSMNLVKGMINLLLLGATVLFTGYTSMDLATFVILGGSGLLGIALGDTLFFEALQKLGPHVLVLLSLIGQVLTALGAVVFLGELLTPAMWWGIAMVMGGIAIVILTRFGGAASRRSTMTGVLYGIGSVICMSLSVIIAKRGLTDVSAVQGTFVRMLWGTTGLFLWGAVRGQVKEWLTPFREVRLMGGFFLLVCIVSYGGFWLFHVAIKNTEVAVATTLSSTEPLFVIPLAALFLGERCSRRALAGTLVAVAGILLLCTG